MATSVPQKDDVERWTVEQVAAWLQQVELADCCEVSLRKGIDGHTLLQLTEEALVLWGRDVSIKNRKQIMKLVTQIKDHQLVNTSRHVSDIQGPRSSSGIVPPRWKKPQHNQQDDAKDDDNTVDFFDEDDFSDDYDSENERESSSIPPPETTPGHVKGDEEYGLYMTPRTVTTTPTYPSQPSRGLPNFPARVPVISAHNLSQLPFPANRLPAPQPSNIRPSLPPTNLPQNQDTRNRAFSLPVVSRGAAPANRGTGAHHGGFSGALRGHGPSDQTPHGHPPPDVSGRGPAPVPGGLDNNLRHQIGLQTANPPFLKPKAQNPLQASSSGGPPLRLPHFPPGPHSSNSPHRPESPSESGGQGVRSGYTLHHVPLSANKPLDGNNSARPPPIIPKPKTLQNPGVTPNRQPISFPRPLNSTSPQSSRPVSPTESGGQGGKSGFTLHPPLKLSKSDEGNNPPRPPVPTPKELKPKFSQPSQSASYAPEKTDHEYEIVDVPPRSFTGTENIHPSSSGLLSPDKTPPALPPRNTADGRDTSSRQAQGIGAQQPPPPIGYNPPKWHSGSSQVLPKSTPKHPSVLPRHLNQPSSLNVSHNRQHESNPDGNAHTPTRPPILSGSPNLNTSRPPAPIPSLPISGPPIPPTSGPPLPSNNPPPIQYPDQYPGQHQTNSLDYLQLDQVPQEMAPAVPGVSPLPSVGMTSTERVNLGDGESIELIPLYRRLMEQPYFHVISRAKSKNILENADDGMFLIRPSTRSMDPLTLCLRHGGRTYNINIRHRRDGLFALGSEKSKEMAFTSVDDIITAHKREPIKLQNGERALLTGSPPKPDRIYVQIRSSR
ncbi:uncharacterized protein [Procambarus clarkii]|uniref:uncharacterized protein isoform X2 n=1 Tax=Procambarus clarkii TaxID=6728 RepID=UPI001E670F36|nr:leucine-rich repeat extensin-like protein 5 isoform X2 [Procambarus clarkii]